MRHPDARAGSRSEHQRNVYVPVDREVADRLEEVLELALGHVVPVRRGRVAASDTVCRAARRVRGPVLFPSPLFPSAHTVPVQKLENGRSWVIAC